MNRDDLVEMTQSSSWTRSVSRNELRALLAMLDERDERIRELENQLGHTPDRSLELASDIRLAANALLAHVDALSANLERRGGVRA